MKKSGTLSGVTALASVLVLAVFSPTASAGGACWQRVIDDWADNSRVDGTYPIQCYREALANLPEDMRAYSTAPDDIARAMREAIRAQQRTVPVPTTTEEEEAVVPPAGGDDTKPQKPNKSKKPEKVEAPSSSGEPDPGPEAVASEGLFTQALDEIGPRDARSFPLPLLLLGLVTVLLTAAAAVAFLARRRHTLRPRLRRR